MSNVRPSYMNATARLSYATEVSFRHRSLGSSCFASPRLGLGSRSARAARPLAGGAPPALRLERATPRHSPSVSFAKQSIQNAAFVHASRFVREQIAISGRRKASRCVRRRSRSRTHRCPPTLAVRPAVSQGVPAQRSWCRPPRPNPSVEGTAKRLRLLPAPHLKRSASYCSALE